MDIPDVHLRVLYDFEYETKDERKVSIRRGEKLFLIKKTNPDWWQVIRCSSERPFFVPASYVDEVSTSKVALIDEGNNSSPDKRLNYASIKSNVQTKNIPQEMGVTAEPYCIITKPISSIHIAINEHDSRADISQSSSSDNLEYTKGIIVSDILHKVEDKKILHGEILRERSETNDPLIESAHVNIYKNDEHDPKLSVLRRINSLGLLSEECCNMKCESLGISPACGSQISSGYTHAGYTSFDKKCKRLERDGNRQLSSSLEKLVQEIKFIAAIKSDDKRAFSVCNTGPHSGTTEVYDASLCFPPTSGQVETYPCEMMCKIENKLSHSRSFKTKRELQKISSKHHVKYLSSSWEGKRISDFSEVQNICVPSFSSEDCDGSHKKKTCNMVEKKSKGVCNHQTSNVELNFSQGCRECSCVQTTPVVPLAFQNALYMLSHGLDTETNKRTYSLSSGKISSESLDGCFMEEDDISDSGTSLKSSELISSVCNDKSYEEKYAEPRNNKVVGCGSSEDIWNPDSYDSVPVPSGWRKSYDEVSGEQCYISETTQATWFSSTDHEGRVYFFEENSSESSWTLPKISIDDYGVPVKKSLPDVPADPLLRSQDGEKRSVHRITKARSMLVADQKQRDSSNKSSSIPRNFLQDKSGILKEGSLNRTKITENSKKVRKNWTLSYVVLRELYLLFYKDLKSSSTLVQPELFVELSGARLEDGEKMSKRKNVFLVSTASLQVLCQCEDVQIALDWCVSIKKAIGNLNKPSAKLLHPYPQIEERKTTSIGRSESIRSKNQDGSVDDQMSSNEEHQTKIRDRLKKFFHRRPTRETLASKGIYKDEPVFDNHLRKVCSADRPRIPKFVKLCISAIEGKEENMKTDGLYRASGNLSHVQKIRLEVDQNNLFVLEKEDDVHVLTGTLKLFFRELKEPLIPYELFTTALEAGELNRDKNAKILMFREIVQRLPYPNRDTLEFLLRHLRKVTEYEEYNRMHIPNLAIVFGPTLIWREKECHQNMALEYMQQNLVIEFFLQQFDEIFKVFDLSNK